LFPLRPALVAACLAAIVAATLAVTLPASAASPISPQNCLARPAGQVTTLSGSLTGTQGDASAPTPTDHAWDLRLMRHEAAMEPGGARYPFVLAGTTRGCIVGGSIVGGIPRDQPRDYWYGAHGSTYDGDGLRLEQTAGSWDYVHGTTIENVSDGITVKGPSSAHVYLDRVRMSYVRDDCIENDDTSHSITITRSLFDGCFSFLSQKAAGASSVDQGTGPGTTTIEDSLVYVNPQRLDSYCGYCTTGADGRTYGNYGFFKWGPSATANVVVRNTIFRMDQRSYSSKYGNRFPPGTYENVTLVWTGSGTFPGTLQPGMRVTTDVSVWDRAKAAWLTGSTAPAPAPASPTATAPTSIPTASATPTSTPTASATPTSTPTASATTSTPTSTPTASATTSTPTSTPTATATTSTPTSAPIPSGSATVLERRVAARDDDSEERPQSGKNIPLNSTDLEMAYDDGDRQVVGLRFSDVTVPRGAAVTRAWIEFRSVSDSDDQADLVIRAQASDDAAAFTASIGDIGSRPTTAAGVTWSPAPWVIGGAYRTPDVAALIQAIVDRPGWSSGRSLALLVSGTSGTRNAMAYDKGADQAAVIHVEWTD
jgi:hypothetical protein